MTTLLLTEYNHQLTLLKTDCLAGYFGGDCVQPCGAGFYGKLCVHKCDCDLKFCNHEKGCLTGKSILHVYDFFFLNDLKWIMLTNICNISF